MNINKYDLITREDCDSNEEWYYFWYLIELLKAGILEDFTYNEDVFIINNKVEYKIEKQLKTKVKIITKTLIREHIYTPDFTLTWNKNHKDYSLFKYYRKQLNVETGKYTSILEIKGTFDRNGDIRLFTSRTQPIIYDKYNRYIQLVKVPTVFKQTFTPGNYIFTDKSGQFRKIKFNTISLKEFTNSI